MNWNERFNPRTQPKSIDLEPSECTNCGAEVTDPFCSQCGQKRVTFNFKYLFQQIGDGIEFKRGLMFNLKVLTLTPGHAIMEYMRGRTKPFMNPISYSLLVVAALFLTGERFILKFDVGFLNSTVPFFIHFLIFTFPVSFGLGSFLAYYKSGLNYVQHFILSLLLVSHFIFLFVLPYVFLNISPQLLVFLFFAYTVWVYHLVFKEHFLLTAINLIAILFLASLSEGIMVGIASVIATLIRSLVEL